jgi:hypothetical protein
MLPEKRGDGFRRRGYSSHFFAEYPRNLTLSVTTSNFAVENRENGRCLGRSATKETLA